MCTDAEWGIPLRKVLSPKQVARALEVSESSVKRWCDQGAIEASYTAGGHRRITLDALVDFVRTSKHQLVEPAAVGLAPGTIKSESSPSDASTDLRDALQRGNEFECRRIVHGLFLAEMSIACICDEVIAPAVNQLGLEWECGRLDVYQERRACEVVSRLTHELSSLVTSVPESAPRAIGGGIEGDPYSLASRMVALVLKDAKWNATSLGPGVPLESFGHAIQDERPRLFWLSVSSLADEDRFVNAYNRLFDEYSDQVAFVLGGQAFTRRLRQRVKYASFCDTMQHLEQFATMLVSQTSGGAA